MFCRQPSFSSITVEHIVPESLGNKTHILPKGTVCDACNNYFAIKLEKEVLQLPFFLSLRGRNTIQNKKGRVPSIPAFIRHPRLLGELNVQFLQNKVIEAQVGDPKLYSDILQKKHTTLYLPYIHEPPQENVLLSRFIGKIALEALAARLMCFEGWENEVLSSLDELREYVRYGKGPLWPYHQRKIYSEGKIFTDNETGEFYEVLHEYDFLFPEQPIVDGDTHMVYNLYFVCAIMGMEFTINMTAGGIDKYVQWLKENENKSILQMEKEEFNPYK